MTPARARAPFVATTFGLVWPGKERAEALARAPARARLVDAKEEGVEPSKTRNLLIEGDNLKALQLLRKEWRGRIDVVYIDPPYNTGRALAFDDEFRESAEQYARRGPTSSKSARQGRKHAAWLDMMYPRLLVARELLSDRGVVLMSIDDREAGHLRVLADEILGGDAFVCDFTWVKKRKGSHLSKTHRSVTEHVLAYAHNRRTHRWYGEAAYAEKMQPLAKKTNARKILTFPAGSVRTSLSAGEYRAGEHAAGASALTFVRPFRVRRGFVVDELVVEGPFVWTQIKLTHELSLGSRVLLSSAFGLNVARHDQSTKIKAPSTLLANVGTNEDAFEELRALFGQEHVFDFAKPVSLLRTLLAAVTHGQRAATVLDFFAGSGTTGHAVMALNARDGGKRRFILVQSQSPLDARRPGHASAAAFCASIGLRPDVVSLTKERLRRAGLALRTEFAEASFDAGFRVQRVTKALGKRSHGK